jgi:hypothetical protein
MSRLAFHSYQSSPLPTSVDDGSSIIEPPNIDLNSLLTYPVKMSHDLFEHHHLKQALDYASLELSLRAPVPNAHAKAVLLRCFWIHANGAESRIALALADLRSTQVATLASSGILATALADRVRDELLRSGARLPPAYVDDFPSSPAMANDDICTVNCAVGFGPNQKPRDLDAALARALDAMFLPGFYFRRHMRLELSGAGQLERQANTLIMQLRGARRSQESS